MKHLRPVICILLLFALLLSVFPAVPVLGAGGIDRPETMSQNARAVSVGSVSVPSYDRGTPSDWMTYDCGQYLSLGNTGTQSKMQIIKGTSGKELLDYRDKLTGLGYTLLYQKAVPAKSGTNRHIKCLSPDGTYTIYAYYVEAYQETRIIVDTNVDTLRSFSYTSSGTGSGNGRTELYMVPLSSSVDGFYYDSVYGSQNRNNAGSMFVIKMSDNSLFVIDGGSYIQMSDRDCERIYAFLRQITGLPEGQKMTVNTWFITHYHDDHVSGFTRFLYKYSTQFDVHNVMYNFDVLDNSVDNLEIAGKLLPNAKYYKQHTGEHFDISGVGIDVLYTIEDLYTPTADNKLFLNDKRSLRKSLDENNVSTVLRVSFDGKTAILTGDINDGDQILMAMYPGAYLHADVLQIPHHGFDKHVDLVKAVAPTISFINQTETAMGNRKANYINNRDWKPYAGTIYYGNSETVGYCAEEGIFLHEPFTTSVDWLKWGNLTRQMEEENYYESSPIRDPEQYYRYDRVDTADSTINGTFAIVDDKLGYPLSYSTADGTVGNALPAFYSNDTYYFGATQRRYVNWNMTFRSIDDASLAIVSGGKGYYVSGTVKKGSGDYWGTNTKNANLALGNGDTFDASGMFSAWASFTDQMEASTNSVRLDMMKDNTFLLYSRFSTNGSTYHPLYRDPSLTTDKGWGASKLSKADAADKLDYLRLRLYSYNTAPDTMLLSWSGHEDYYADPGISKSQALSLLTADLRVRYTFENSGDNGEIFYDGWQSNAPGTYWLEFPSGYSGSIPGNYTISIKFKNHAGTVLDLGSITLHINDRSNDPATKSLFFDFGDDADDRLKYQYETQYNGVNFDSSSLWEFIEYNSSNKTNDTTAGFVDTLSGTLKLYTKTADTVRKNLSFRTYASIKENQYTNVLNPLNYSPEYAEVVQIRFKMENLKAAAESTPNFRLCYLEDGETALKYEATYSLNSTSMSDGSYVTITVDLSQAFRDSTTITGLRPAFSNLIPADTSEVGCVTVDYLYIGPREDAPAQEDDSLFFDFRNFAEDRERYTREAYNALGFDRENQGNWATSETSTTAKVYNDYSVSNADGTLTVNVAEGIAFDSGNEYCGPWIATAAVPGVFSSRSNRTFHALGYEPSAGDCVQIRFKVEGCVSATGADPRVVVVYDRSVDGVTDRGSYDMDATYALVNGKYQTLTIPVTEEFASADVITTLGFRFWDIQSQSAGSGRVVIDYIYVGHPDSMPATDHLVTFAQEDGTLLYQTPVYSGGSATYEGSVPVKDPDELYHYSFSQWVDKEGNAVDLNHIRDAVTVYPAFKAEDHIFIDGACSSCGLESHLVADTQTVVLDYGKPIDIEVVRNAEVSGASELLVKHAWLTGAFFAEESDSNYGTTQLVDRDEDGKPDSLRFTPAAMLDKILRINCIMEIPAEDGTLLRVAVPLKLIPATVVYYESDFAQDIFDLQVVGSTEEKYQWYTDGTSRTETQETGNVGDQLYDFVIHKESIPSNAFFADFDGDNGRYFTDAVYDNVDFDQSEAWSYNDSRMREPVIDQNTGTMTLSMIANGDSIRPYVQTGENLLSGYHLNYHPGEDHYVQVRFKLENFRIKDTSARSFFMLHYYTGTDKTQGEGTGDDRIRKDVGEEPIPDEAFRSGEYITLTFKLNSIETTKITALRFFVSNVVSKSDTELGVMTVDYFYVGPLTDKGSEPGQDYRGGAPALLFDFKNDTAAATRYQGSQYQKAGGNINYDLPESWVVYYGTNEGKETSTENYSVNHDEGVVNVPVGKVYTTSSGAQRYGPYLYMANDNGGGITYTENSAPNWRLNYTVPSGKLYFHVRFKVTGAEFDEGGTQDEEPYVQCTIAGYKADGSRIDQHPRMSYDDETVINSGNFYEGVLDITGDITTYGFESIQALYVRFVHLKQSGKKPGQIQVDYIYVGPESDPAKVHQMQEETILIDFNNGDIDKQRYSGSLYSGVNYDLAENWISNLEGTDVFYYDSVENGSLKLVPGPGQINHPSGYGSIYPEPYTESKLNYKLTGNDHLQMRFRFVGATHKGSAPYRAKLAFGGEPIPYTTAGQYDYARDAFRYEWHLDAAKVEAGEWITVTYDLSDFDWKGEKPDTIRFLIPIFQNVQYSDGGYVLIDYIYLGPVVEARPVSDSLFFGFDNLNQDRERYESDAYGGYHYDEGNWATSPELNDSAADFMIDNAKGTLTLPVTDKLSTENIHGPYLVTIKSGAAYIDPHDPSMASLSYKPCKAQYVQVRFRVNNCETPEDESSNVIFLFGGYDRMGDWVDYDSPSYKYMRGYFTVEEGYQTITFPVSDNVSKLLSITNFGLRFQRLKSNGQGDSYVEIDYIYVGPGELAPDPVYGYDSSYTDDTDLSNGSSWVVEGSGVKIPDNPTNYTQAQFSFKGTGFDIISRTGKDQATIRVEVTNNATNEVVKTLTVNNKGELELSQIPVVSVEGLEYGEYTVTLWVNKAVSTGISFLDRGGQFYFDAVRIYEPMGPDYDTKTVFAEAYKADKEAHPHVKEIRNILLSAEAFASQLNAGSGAIFVDSAEEPTATVPATDANGDPIPGSTTTVTPEGIDVNGHITASVITYDKIGPKNEVYLAPGQAVAFMLKISTEYVPTSVDVGVKIIKANETANLVAGIVKKNNPTATGLLQVAGRRDIPVGSATAQYYALPIDADTFFTAQDGNRYCYIVLYNNGTAGITNVLSVTDIKVAYDKEPEIGLPRDAITDQEIHKRSGKTAEPYYDFMVDSHTLEAAALVMKAVLETPLFAEGTKLMHSLNLASDISVNYAVSKESMACYRSFYLEVKIPGREEALRIDPVEKDFYYYFTLDGFTAVQMNDTLEATLYMEKNGRIYRSETDIYSIAQYAYTQLGKDTVAKELKTLCAELLRYGSAAQIFKGYRTDALADGSMTEEQRAYLTDLSAVTFGTANRQLADLTAPTAKWLGKSLILDSKVTLRYVVDLTACETVDNITLRVRYRDYAGTEQTAILTEAEPYGSVEGCYSFDFSGLLAAELRTVLQAAVYAGDTRISNTLEYSVDTYGNNKTGNLLTLCKALFAYSDSAKTYFAP